MKNKSTLYLIIIGAFTLGISVASFFTYKYLTDNNSIFDSGSTKAIFTSEKMPRIDGSTACAPLLDSFYANFLNLDLKDVNKQYSKTHNAYVNLIENKTDLIIVTEPSEEELALAKAS